MTRKEICDKLEQAHMKVAFTLGAMLYDEATDRGGKPLTAEAVEGLDDAELSSLNVFVLELIAAEPGTLPEELEAAFEAVGAVLKSRSVVRNCVANQALEGLICDEDDVAATQRIASGETTLEAELDTVEARYRDMGLRPGHHGEDCPGNGKHPGVECQCDECDHYLECFPDWRELEGE